VGEKEKGKCQGDEKRQKGTGQEKRVEKITKREKRVGKKTGTGGKREERGGKGGRGGCRRRCRHTCASLRSRGRAVSGTATATSSCAPRRRPRSDDSPPTAARAAQPANRTFARLTAVVVHTQGDKCIAVRKVASTLLRKLTCHVESHNCHPAEVTLLHVHTLTLDNSHDSQAQGLNLRRSIVAVVRTGMEGGRRKEAREDG